MKVKQTNTENFIAAYGGMKKSPYADALTFYTANEYRKMGTALYLLPDQKSGCGINPDGELISVFSCASVKGQGRGNILVTHAIAHGADHLDVIGEFLREFYEKHGFREVRREPNFTAGEPDFIVMERNPRHN